MKNFFRSVAGKTVLFITFTLCLCIALAGFAGIFGMVEVDVYNNAEEKILNENREHYIFGRAFNFAWVNLNNTGDVNEFIDNENSNIEVILRNADGKAVAYTERAFECSENEEYQKTEYEVYVTVDANKNYNIYQGSPNNRDEFFAALKEQNTDAEICTLEAYVNPELPLSVSFETEEFIIHLLYVFRYSVYPLLVLALLLCVLSFVELMSVAGHRPDTEDFYQGAFFKVPFDVLLAVAVTAAVLLTMLVASFEDDILIISGVVVCGIVIVNLLLGLSMSFASRVKQNALIKNTLIYHIIRISLKFIKNVCVALISALKRMFKGTLKLIRCVPMVWRTLLIIAAVCFVELMFMAAVGTEDYPGLWIMEKVITIPLILIAAIIMRKLQKAGVAIADGNLEYKVETKGMFWDFKKHAENLNSISRGMSQAVEQRLKSERMKTELITNVSHDIKTPLTSIINYAGLISNEQTDNPNIAQYSEVLLRQSEKLKRLIDDLVEASKASTGNIEVVPIPCDAAVFITQTSGEYEEKLNNAGLSLITQLPKQNIDIMADSRRMWRIFDNLMNNILKYSQNGTRVYLSLENIDNKAVITFKNTSREILNISTDELMERFVRGDSSRNTDGNGLGLSIARSLTELQGGEFNISIDGDLFKVTLKFPVI